MTYRDLDLRLIEALLEDGRRSVRKLAEVLKVSPSTVSHRLNDLTDRGVISRFKPVIDYGRLGYGLIAVTKIKNLPDDEKIKSVFHKFDPKDGELEIRTTGNQTLTCQVTIQAYSGLIKFLKNNKSIRGKIAERT